MDAPNLCAVDKDIINDGMWLGMGGVIEFDLLKLIFSIRVPSRKSLTTTMIIRYIDTQIDQNIKTVIYTTAEQSGCPRTHEPKYRAWLIRILQYFGFVVVSGRTMAITIHGNVDEHVTFFRTAGKVYTGDHQTAIEQYITMAHQRVSFVQQQLPQLFERSGTIRATVFLKALRTFLPHCKSLYLKDLHIHQVSLTNNNKMCHYRLYVEHDETHLRERERERERSRSRSPIYQTHAS